jgi:hypothetical protein
VLVTTNSRVERTEWTFWVKLSFNTWFLTTLTWKAL